MKKCSKDYLILYFIMHISRIMESSGMSDTGYEYLVLDDGLMAPEKYSVKENSYLSETPYIVKGGGVPSINRSFNGY